MSDLPELERAREAHRRRAWREAHEAFTAAEEAEARGSAGPLGAEDLERAGLCAYLLGFEEEYLDRLERAHHAHLEADAPERAARCAFWLGFTLADRGESGPASGWLARARRLVQDRDCVEQGYLLLPVAHQQFAGGDPAGAYETAVRAAGIAERFGDRDLLALALHVEGRGRVRQGRVEEGLALLDEAMIAVAGDELSPNVTGLIYCSVLSACRDTYALRRAHEWTDALSAWCEAQPDLVAYRGQCRVHRAEVMQLRGAWRAAIEEARQAAAGAGQGSERPAAAAAHYQRGEAHRLLGELAAAEEAYRAASRSGREPQPGLALLRVAQGDTAAAVGSIRRALAETPDRLRRARLLPAHVEIMLASGDLPEAERACEELEEIAAAVGTEYLDAAVAHARGALWLARGDARGALVSLRAACHAWQGLEAPYQAARARELLADACRDLGDEDAATLELDAARAAYEALGAAQDHARVAGIGRDRSGPHDHGLTPREREVLALVATGKTNRSIADALFISEKTVARHLSNIFSKLGLSSRAAATAYAYEHDLLHPPA